VTILDVILFALPAVFVLVLVLQVVIRGRR